jgi:hypothetical protein
VVKRVKDEINTGAWIKFVLTDRKIYTSRVQGGACSAYGEEERSVQGFGGET